MTMRMWNHLSTTDFTTLDRDNTLVLLPMGSTEQHGPHMPVGTDYFILQGMLKRVLSRLSDLEVIVLPPLWCTKSDEHKGSAGTIYLRSETLMAVVHDLMDSIHVSGFRRVAILNWHGGNTNLVSAMAQDIRRRHDLLIFTVDIVYSFNDIEFEPPGLFELSDIHAGRFETSLMLAEQPDLIKPGPYDLGNDLKREPLKSGFSNYELLVPEGGPVRMGWKTTDLTHDGVIGNPAGANEAEGERNWKKVADRVETILREIATFEFPDPLEE